MRTKRLSLAVCGVVFVLTGCGGLMQADMRLSVGQYPDAITLYESYLAENPASTGARSRLGFAYLKTGRIEDAVNAFETVLKQEPGQPHAVLYLGLAYVNQGEYGKAVEVWQGYRNAEKPLVEEEIRRQVTLLQIAESQRRAQQALAEEAALRGTLPPDNTIAVFYFRDMTPDNSLAAFQKALAAMIITDLGKIGSLQVVERVRLQALLDEMRLGQTGVVDAGSAQRIGRLLGARNIVAGNLMTGSLKVATTVNDQTSAVTVQEQDFWQIPIFAVKTAVQALGLEISDAEQAAIGVPRTRNLKAFTYYGQALMAQDAGNWKKAKDLFTQSLKEDPNFDLGRDGADGCPGSDSPSVSSLSSMTAASIASAVSSAVDAAAAAQADADVESSAGGGGGDGGAGGGQG